MDLGKRFPLRFSTTPARHDGIFCLLVVSICLVIPVWYLSAEGLEKFRWIYGVMMVFGCGAFYLAVLALTTRFSILIDGHNVRLSNSRLFRTREVKVPLSEYIALLTPTSEEPGFIGQRKLFSIVLWHHSDVAKQVSLYTTPSERKLQERCWLYEELFRLPVNPETIKIGQIPEHMSLGQFHDCEQCRRARQTS
jgi:hypothetical protein